MRPFPTSRVSWQRAAASALALAGLFGGQAAGASAQGGITFSPVVDLSGGSYPTDLVYGPESSFWLPLAGANAIGQLTLPGTVQNYDLSAEDAFPLDATIGPDQQLWFTEQDANGIGLLEPAGSLMETYLPEAGSAPDQITLGQDGAVWFTEYEGSRIGRLTPDGDLDEFELPHANSKPKGIATALDGSLWFTEWNGARIGKIVPPGELTEYAIPNPPFRPSEIALGPDGNLWFTYEIGKDVTRLNPSDGTMTHFTLPTASSALSDLTLGPDGKMWFVGVHTMGRFDVTPTGPANLVETPLDAPVFSGLGRSQITAGPDGKMYFITANSQTVFEIPLASADRRDVQVFVTHLPQMVLAAGQFTMEVEAVNWSAAGAADLSLDLTLDENITYVSAANPAGACSAASGHVLCDLGDLAGGDRVSLSFTFQVSRISGASAPRTLTVEVAGAEADYLPANNREFRFITIQQSFDYFNDFSGDFDQHWSLPYYTDPLGGRDVLGAYANDQLTLTFENLPPHDRADLCFDLYVLGGWDGSAMVDPFGDSSTVIGPDLWAHYVDDDPLRVTSFSNSEAFSQAFPDDYRKGAHPARQGAGETGDFSGSGSGEARYHLCSELNHSGPTYQATFYGLNLDESESWALDNVRVRIYYHAVYDWLYVPLVAK